MRHCRNEPKGEGRMNLEAMHRNLLDFKGAMDRQNIPFVFIFGTLLGVVRDGDLIKTDTDVDLACFTEDHLKMLPVIEELEIRGFYIPDRNECPLHDHFFMRDDEKIEVWWFDKLDGERIYNYKVRYDSKYFDTLEEIGFLGEKWKIPGSPREFLTITYGENWTVPDPKGNYILGKK